MAVVVFLGFFFLFFLSCCLNCGEALVESADTTTTTDRYLLGV